jgi:hypothetical protein
MRTPILIVGTFALMLACGAAAMVGMIRALISVGLKYHNNYEYYGQTPAVLLIPIATVFAFAMPAIIVWRLHRNRWQVSLRTMLIGMTAVAVLLGLALWALKVE